MCFGRARTFGDAAEVFIGQQALLPAARRRYSRCLLFQRLKQTIFHPTFEHAVLGLVDQARVAERFQNLRGFTAFFCGIVGDANVKAPVHCGR